MKKVFIDIDGVLADVKSYAKENSLNPEEDIAGFFQYMILHKGFTKLKPLPFSEVLEYLEEIRKTKNIEVNILGSYGRKDNTSLIIDKNEWLIKNVPFSFDGVYLVAGKHKKQIFADGNSILIDDTRQNIEDFVSRGGFGILHTNQEDTLVKLKSWINE